MSCSVTKYFPITSHVARNGQKRFEVDLLVALMIKHHLCCSLVES